jgi:hypothetical protein
MDWPLQTLSAQPRSVSTGRRELRRVGVAQSKDRTQNRAIFSCSASMAACTTVKGTQNLAAHTAAALSAMVKTFVMPLDRGDTTRLAAAELGQYTGTSGRARGDNEPTEAWDLYPKSSWGHKAANQGRR